MKREVATRKDMGRSLRVAAMVTLWLLGAVDTARAQYFPDDRNSCRSCHVDSRNKTDFCELFEATIYERDDKHGKAFFLLHESDPSDPRKGQAKRELVRQILGFELREAFADAGYTRLIEANDEVTRQKVATVKACLRCHGTWPAAADKLSPTQPPVALALGVSCQACHGPGLQWNLAHYLPPHAWRVVTPEAKASLGFTDVRSPVKKAELCASCHVGSVSEDKLVKHEWYAGGHPPLPGFELASFQAQMPMHWKPFAEKPAFAFRDGSLARQDAGVAANLQNLQQAGVPAEAIKENCIEANFAGRASTGSDLSRTRDVTLAGLAVFGTYVRLVSEYAEQAAAGKAAWPELALYDCGACHHELRAGLETKSRPKRSHTPGRPTLATWPMTLAPLAAGNRWAEIENGWLKLNRAATSRPFGEPATMRAEGEALLVAIRQLAGEAASKSYDRESAKRAMEWLSDPKNVETNDFFAARQAAWAMSEIAKDVASLEMKNLFQRDGADPLCLNLPSGQERSVMENLGRWLPATTKYEAEWLRGELRAIGARIATP